MGKFYKRQKSGDSDRRSSAIPDEDDPLNDQETDSPFVTACNWLASPNDGESNDFKTRPGNAFGRSAGQILPSPGIGLPPPRSPVLSRLQTPSTLDGNEGSRSLPCSPRMQRRRANTLDTPANFALSSSWTNLKTALERSLSTPTTKQGARLRAESSPTDLEVSLFYQEFQSQRRVSVLFSRQRLSHKRQRPNKVRVCGRIGRAVEIHRLRACLR